MREIGGAVLGSMRDALVSRLQPVRSSPSAIDPATEPPVVAQLMIEIRSDGSHTIARGALNDLRSQESAQIRAEGRTPAELMASLAASLLALPVSLLRGPGAGTAAQGRAETDRRPAQARPVGTVQTEPVGTVRAEPVDSAIDARDASDTKPKR